MVMAVLLLGLLGIGVELLLLEHTEGFWQRVPVGLILLGFIVLAWHSAARGSPAGMVKRKTPARESRSVLSQAWAVTIGPSANFVPRMYWTGCRRNLAPGT